VETSRAECYWNWVRNIEYMSTYLFTRTVLMKIIPTQYWKRTDGRTHAHTRTRTHTHTQIIIMIIIILMWDPSKKYNKSTLCWHFITFYLLFFLYKGMMMNWFNPRHMDKAYEWEYILSYNCCINLLSSTTPMILVRMQQGWTALKLWQWMVNFTPRLLYCHGRSPQYPLNSWLYGPQSQSGFLGDELNLLSPGGFEP
jgi:hypothetical protein